MIVANSFPELMVRATEPALAFDIAKGRRAVDELLTCDPRFLGDRAFLLEVVSEFGVIWNDWPGLEDFKGAINASRFGVCQIPSEFVDYLLILRHYRPATYLEIGTLHGGTAVLAAAYLSRLNRRFRMTCVDLEDNFIDYSHFAGLLPLTLRCPSTSTDFIGARYDVAFIDGDHSYNGALKDYLNVGRYAGICALHDIKGHEYDHLNGGTVRLWGEVKNHAKKSNTLVEISHSRPNWMGIGLVLPSAPALAAA